MTPFIQRVLQLSALTTASLAYHYIYEPHMQGREQEIINQREAVLETSRQQHKEFQYRQTLEQKEEAAAMLMRSHKLSRIKQYGDTLVINADRYVISGSGSTAILFDAADAIKIVHGISQAQEASDTHYKEQTSVKGRMINGGIGIIGGAKGSGESTTSGNAHSETVNDQGLVQAVEMKADLLFSDNFDGLAKEGANAANDGLVFDRTKVTRSVRVYKLID